MGSTIINTVFEAPRPGGISWGLKNLFGNSGQCNMEICGVPTVYGCQGDDEQIIW